MSCTTTTEKKLGCFIDSQAAYKRGLTLGREFAIEKIEIGCFRKRFEKYASGRTKSCIDLYYLAKKEPDLLNSIEKSDTVAGFYYRSDGILCEFWSLEINPEDEAVPNRFNNGRFEYSSVNNMPNPFEKGDIVRFMDTGDYGIVEMSHEEWSSSLEHGNDYFGSYIKVLLFCNNRKVRHHGQSPILLEKYEPEENDRNYELLMLGREAYIGNIPLESFFSTVKEYK